MTDPETAADVAVNIRRAVEYIEKQYPGAKTLDAAPILRNMKRWADRIERAMAASAVPVESLGGGAEFASDLDAALRARGLPMVANALGYSRNFAAANPHLTQTAKDHINGLCDMLEIAAGQHAPPPASVPDVLCSLYAAAAKGFHVSKSCGPDKKYHYVSKFDSLDDLQAYQSAWTAAMVSVRDAVPNTPEESP